VTSRRYRHVTKPEPEAAELDDDDEKSRRQQVGAAAGCRALEAVR